MKTLVLNLERREDRKELFERTNSGKLDYEFFEYTWDGYNTDYNKIRELGFDTDPNWIDPIEGTHLTRGEVGCFLSHYYAWRYCIESNEPILILEDDAIVTSAFNIKRIETQLKKGYDFVYLGWKEMEKSLPIKNNKTFVVPVYPYWTVGYVITPECAKKFVCEETEKSIIPVDEFLALQMKNINPIGYKKNVVEQRDREEVGSDVTTGDRYDAFLDFGIHVLTVGTDEKKCEKLYNSAAYNNINLINLGKDTDWNGGDMTIRGGGQKLLMVRDYIQRLQDRDIIFFCDAYDVFFTDTIGEIIYRYLEIGHKILFGAERICWPNEEYAGMMRTINKNDFPDLSTPYQYLNSGVFIANVGELKRILTPSIQIRPDESDQLWIQKKFIDRQYDIALDTDCYIFQCHEPLAHKDEDNGQLLNPVTGCYNCVYHGNGGEEAKQTFIEKYEEFYGVTDSPIIYIPTQDYEILEDDIILIDFLTESMCDSLIELSEGGSDFKSLSYDDVPGQEMRLREIDLWDNISKHWERSISPIIQKHWDMCGWYGLRDAFIIKYTMEGQKKLRVHTDASLVTGSVKLNDSYSGGELYFPRQDFSNKDIPVGKCILFPGQVTHCHESKPITEGTKYSLTMWTQRYEGDSI